jgi:hypothetical protein
MDDPMSETCTTRYDTMQLLTLHSRLYDGRIGGAGGLPCGHPSK